MEPVTAWSLIVGAVFTLSALGKGPLKRWPISLSAVYLLVGCAIGPWGLDLLKIDLIDNVKLIESITEVAVLVSLLTAGLQLAPSWSAMKRAPIPLATLTMVLTIASIAALSHFALGIPAGAAVLLGAVLAPTDPVLASEVQVRHHNDTDRLRYALTGEAGLNDGAAFPFIMLGLGLLGIHDIGHWGWRWVAIDLVWATTAGLASGWGCGILVSRAAIWMKRSSNSPAASEELLTLGLIGLSYGVALLIHSYGFLAVFAAGVAMRHYADDGPRDPEAVDLMKTVSTINEHFGHILEVALVVMAGALLAAHWTLPTDWWVAVLLFFVFRPLSVELGLLGRGINRSQRRMISFFGIRGIGSLYYLSFAIDEGLDHDLAERLGGIVLTAVALSLMVHSNLASVLIEYLYDDDRSEPQE